MDRRQPLKVCITFLTGCAIVLSPVYFLQNNVLMGILAFLMVGWWMQSTSGCGSPITGRA